MEIRRLEYFVCIAEQGSLCRASDVLRIAQPALTRQVRLLEQELGVPLFTRTRRGMRLTEEGEQLLAEVIKPLRQLEVALQNIRSFSSALTGNVVIGMPPTVAYFLAQPLLEHASRKEPNIDVRIVEGSTEYLAERLSKGELDIAVLYDPSNDEKFHTRELITEEMMIVGPANCSLSPDRVLTFQELITFPLILPNPRNGLRAVSERLAAKYKTHFKVKYVIDSFSTMKQMVIDGHGYCILPLSAVMKEIDSGIMTYSPNKNPISRTLVLGMVSEFRVPRTVEKISQLLQETVLDMYNKKRVIGDIKISGATGADRTLELLAG